MGSGGLGGAILARHLATFKWRTGERSLLGVAVNAGPLVNECLIAHKVFLRYSGVA